MVSQLLRFYRTYGILGSLKEVAESPEKAWTLTSSGNHFYTNELPVHREDVATVVPRVANVTLDEALSYWEEIGRTLPAEIERQLQRTDDRPDTLHSNWRELIYILVRATSPSVVVETGTHDGLGSAYILAALGANGQGELITIDINDQTQLPSDLPSAEAGWIVPESLRDRWELRYADARKELPSVASDNDIDMFLHDSLHTPEHMEFEFSTIAPALTDGAVVVTDNSRFNDVFWDFSQRQLEDPVFWRSTSRAEDHDGNVVDDRLGIGVYPTADR
jgi:predicted O-methyltransferase YrrM